MSAKKKTAKKKTEKKKTASPRRASKKKTGRKPILTNHEKKRRRLLKALEDGHYVETACRLAGIGESTYYYWLDRGEKEYNRLQRDYENGLDLEFDENEKPFLEFLEASRVASAKAEDSAVQVIKKAFKSDDWRAAAQFLERRFYKRWGKVEKHELTGVDGRPIQTNNTSAEVKGDLTAEQSTDIYLRVMRGEQPNDAA